MQLSMTGKIRRVNRSRIHGNGKVAGKADAPLEVADTTLSYQGATGNIIAEKPFYGQFYCTPLDVIGTSQREWSRFGY